MEESIKDLVYGTDDDFIRNYSILSNKRFYIECGKDWRVIDRVSSFQQFKFSSVVFADLVSVCNAMNNTLNPRPTL
jgi:hypothetical protein